jgi:REase_DpnII-MboI
MVPMNQSLYLQPSLDRLRVAVLEQNRPGSVEGLLAHHILKDDSRISVDWQVGCTQEWIDTEFKPTHLDHVAALGYFLWAQPTSKFTAQLLDGLGRMRERDAFKGEHLSLSHNPTRLLGIILGSLALGAAASETLTWCREVLEKMRQKGLTDFDPLVPYLFFRAFDEKVSAAPHSTPSLYELAFADWAIRHQMQQGESSLQRLNEDRQSILFQAATDLRFESASQAAFIWSTVTSILFYALGAASLQPKHVAAVLLNFEAAMKRWRWDGEELQKPVRWPVTQEREIQDILWLILRSYFPDVVDEDALPKLGHSTYKADFGIGSLKLIIEAKFATSKDDFKKIEKEVQEDCIPYLRDLRYESLIVFIYDDSASVQEHDTTRRALLEIPGIVDVVIVSRPSQLAPKSVAPGPMKRPRKQPP